ncbi:12568_t:CDS:1, partial [Entrophospora sp. SA101]
VPNQHAGNNIDTPARFIAWLRHKYQTETVRSQQVALQITDYFDFDYRLRKINRLTSLDQCLFHLVQYIFLCDIWKDEYPGMLEYV